MRWAQEPDELTQAVVDAVRGVECVQRVTRGEHQWPEFYIVTSGSERIARQSVKRALKGVGKGAGVWVWFLSPIVKGEARAFGKTVWKREGSSNGEV